MTPYSRPPLGGSPARYLAKAASDLAGAGNTYDASTTMWRGRSGTAWFDGARATLEAPSLTGGRCVYCEHDRCSSVDHFIPRRTCPDRTFDWENWIPACQKCNTTKRNQFSADLLDPSGPDYAFEDHFEFKFATGEFDLLTTKAEASEPVFGLNEVRLVEWRREHFEQIQADVAEYHRHQQNGDHGKARIRRNTIRTTRFRTVFQTVLRWHRHPRGRLLLDSDCVAALDARPEIRTW